MKKTVISLTPGSLDKDSRTLKMAATFARRGYRSIVVEHVPSQRNFEALGIEIIPFETSVHAVFSSPKRTNHLRGLLTSAAKFIWHGMRYVGLGLINDRISFYRFKKIFKEKYSLENRTIPQADIYIFHSYERVDFALKLPQDSIVIYDAHDFYSDMQPSSQQSSLVKNWILPYQRRLEEKLIDRSNIFITVSDGIAQKYEESFKKTPYVIRNLHDSRIDVVTNKDIRTHLQLDKSTFITCVMGNFKLGMAYDESVEAFSKLAGDSHLVFIGANYDNKVKCNKNIHFIDSLNPEEIVPFISTADCGLINYFDFTDDYKYALPNRFFQMMAAGLPLLYPAQLIEIDKLNKIYEFGIPTNVKCVHDIIENVKKLRTNGNINYYRKNTKNAKKQINWEKEEQNLINIIIKE